MASIEEQVEEHCKAKLKSLGIKYYGKTERINDAITRALTEADSKSGGSGSNYPDIRLLIENSTRRDIPVMIEAKGTKGRLEKLTKDGDIELVSGGKNPNRAVQQHAVNGALHYGQAILKEGTYKEVIVIGINGTTLKGGEVADFQMKAYYVAARNDSVPKEIGNFDFVQMKPANIDAFFAQLDMMSLSAEEAEKVKRDKEEMLEQSVKRIHQRIYDDADMKNMLGMSDKLFFFCGLIMAGLTTKGVSPLEVDDFHSNDDTEDNDGTLVIARTRSFLKKRKSPEEKIKNVVECLDKVFSNRGLWKPINGESIIKSVYRQVKEEILPLLESNVHLDFTGKILNSLNDWVQIENDRFNDVVLTPRTVTNLMARIARTDMDSFVWDTCMGSGGFLVSAMEIMIADAEKRIADKEEREKKIESIRQRQLLGIELLSNVFILSVLNMILMGDGSSQIICGDSHDEGPKFMENHRGTFPANVFLLNPPYSAPGKGLIFADEALSRMESGYGAVLIQENAGSGQGAGYSESILRHSTLVASIHMPSDLFSGKASVQTAIYLFRVNRPHEEDDIVTFIDFSNDGYSRQNRKKSTQKVNLRNTDHALERYDEVAAICLGKKPKTDYYTEANGLVIRDTVSLKGDDWTFNQHKKIDTTPTEEDFRKTVADYLAWKVSTILKGEASADV